MPLRLHLACKLGRRWLCLNCFAVEEGGVAAFRRARCVGRAPTADAGRALFNAVVRYGPRAGLLGAAQTRLSELWAAAGCQVSVFTSAQPPERLTEPMRLSVIGRALLGGQMGVVENPKRTPGEVGSHPFGPSQLGLCGAKAAEDGTKRRRICVSHEVPRYPARVPLRFAQQSAWGASWGRRGPCALPFWGKPCCGLRGTLRAPACTGQGWWPVARGQSFGWRRRSPTSLRSVRFLGRLSALRTGFC